MFWYAASMLIRINWFLENENSYLLSETKNKTNFITKDRVPLFWKIVHVK